MLQILFNTFTTIILVACVIRLFHREKTEQLLAEFFDQMIFAINNMTFDKFERKYFIIYAVGVIQIIVTVMSLFNDQWPFIIAIVVASFAIPNINLFRIPRQLIIICLLIKIIYF